MAPSRVFAAEVGGADNCVAVGDKVRLRRRALKEHLRDFVEVHLVPSTAVLDAEDLHELQGLLEALLDRQELRGRVEGFGQLDEAVGLKTGLERRCVYVAFPLGNGAVLACYFDEDELRLV